MEMAHECPSFLHNVIRVESKGQCGGVMVLLKAQWHGAGDHVDTGLRIKPHTKSINHPTNH